MKLFLDEILKYVWLLKYVKDNVRAVERPWLERQLPRALDFRERKNCQIFNFKTH